MNFIRFKIVVVFFAFAFSACILQFFLMMKRELKQHKLTQKQLSQQIQIENKKFNSLQEKVVLNDKLIQTMQNNMFEVCKDLLQMIK